MKQMHFRLTCIPLLLFFLAFARAQTDALIGDAYHQFYQEKDYDSSAVCFEGLVSANPFHHDYVVRLAFSYYYLGQYVNSIAAFEKAIEMGPWPDIYSYFIAINYVKLGDQDNAMKWLGRSVFDHKWPDYPRLKRSKMLSELQDLEEYGGIFGWDKLSDDRDQRWRNDLNYTYSKLQLLHHNLYNTTEKAIWESRRDAMMRSIPKQSDKEIVIDLMKFAALAGEGHTKILPPEEGENAFRAMPLEVYLFEDGLYITRTLLENKHLLGKEVLSIGSKSISELRDLAYPYRGHENILHHRKMLPRYLVMAEALRDMEAVIGLDTIEIVVKGGEDLMKVKVATKTLADLDTSAWFAGPHLDQHDLSYQNQDEDFWSQSIDSLSTMYLKIRYIVNGENASFRSFIEQTFHKIDSMSVENLVIDLRNCGGGNSELNKYLLHEVIKRPQLNTFQNLSILIGRGTYSAAMNLVADLEYHTEGAFIGEPTGSSPNFIGESNVFTLPNSNLYLVISNRYHQGGANNSLDKRSWIAPDTFIAQTSRDYFAGNDPALDYLRLRLALE